MLELIFGTPIIEKVLFYLLINEKCYPSQLKTIFKIPLYSFQRALARLEKGGIIVSHREGKTLIYQFNPRYPFLNELKSFLQKAYDFFPENIRKKYYEPIKEKAKTTRKTSMIDWAKISLKDLAGFLAEELRKKGIETILVGGACVTIYSENRYQSYDLDYVTYEDMKKVKKALSDLGFTEKSGYFHHINCPWIVEFVSPPVAVGNEPISKFNTIQTPFRNHYLASTCRQCERSFIELFSLE